MRKLLLYENSICKIDQSDIHLVNTLMDMSEHVRRSLGLPYSPFQIQSGNTIRVERVIGNISQNDVNIVILPKVNTKSLSAGSEKDVLKRFFLRTLKSSGDKLGSTVYFAKTDTIDDQGLLLEVLAEYYYESLSKAIRTTSISTYQTLEKKTVTVKGKILVQRQLSEPVTDAKVWCRYKKISNDNEFNQLLVWACDFLKSSIHEVPLKRKFTQITNDFGQQSSVLSYQIVSDLRLPKQYEIYKECFAIAKNLYLKHSGVKEQGVGKHTSGYVISTERAFEHIIEAYCKKAANILGYAHRGQALTQLAQSENRNISDFYIIPDDLIFTKEKRLVVDAKYKKLSGGETRNRPLTEDFYQIISSCIAQNASEGILVYPSNRESVRNSWKILQKINGTYYTIRCAFVDVFADDETVLSDVSKMLINTSFHGVIK